MGWGLWLFYFTQNWNSIPFRLLVENDYGIEFHWNSQKASVMEFNFPSKNSWNSIPVLPHLYKWLNYPFSKPLLLTFSLFLQAWVTLGRAQLNFGEPDSAIESFDTALAIKVHPSFYAKDENALLMSFSIWTCIKWIQPMCAAWFCRGKGG